MFTLSEEEGAQNDVDLKVQFRSTGDIDFIASEVDLSKAGLQPKGRGDPKAGVVA